ncbi:hypothetical protein BD410DRAFT_167834 [Rickenella mellea]|uniref:Uncharacterized protein n=1 Tax=Rickenella mellea TaxID=50990 RepID=A0A4Y7PIG3_9AGAM|nr:hypothetical protein BD410DRAFT_167834 [Rickenella mellea]
MEAADRNTMYLYAQCNEIPSTSSIVTRELRGISTQTASRSRLNQLFEAFEDHESQCLLPTRLDRIPHTVSLFTWNRNLLLR